VSINIIQVGAGRYIQGENALSFLGDEISRLGMKQAFVIAGKKAYREAGDKVKSSLDKSSISYQVTDFAGEVCMSNIDQITRKAIESNAEVIIGVGGGKCMDATKIVAIKARKPLITVATSVATCAAYSPTTVLYEENGSMVGMLKHKQNQVAVIVDEEIIVNAPARLIASGIGDSIAKYHEIRFAYENNETNNLFLKMGFNISKLLHEDLMVKGYKAYLDVKEGNNSQAVSDVITDNIQITGIVSGLSSGGNQLAIAHAFYEFVHRYFHDRTLSLHGEIVSVGILMQMYVNGDSHEEIQKMKDFFVGMEIPVTLKEVGIEPTEDNLRILIKAFRELNKQFRVDGLENTIVESIKKYLA